MNRVGVMSIVLAAAVTGACGGSDGVSPAPTGPSLNEVEYTVGS